MKKCKLLLFDLDGTLLQSDKTISTRTLSALKKCRGNDILIGVSTSRSEQNSLVFLNELMVFTATEQGEQIPSEKLLSRVFEKQKVHTLLQIITYWIDDDEYRIDFVLWQDNRSI